MAFDNTKKSSGTVNLFANPIDKEVILKLLLLSTELVYPVYKNCLLWEREVEKLTGFFPPNQGSEKDML